jgi:hypothetical protein
MCTGMFEGRLNARSKPVTRAEPSVIEMGFLRINLWIRYSNSMHDITEAAVTITAPIPKKKMEVNSAGSSAITTPYISFFVVTGPYA